MKTPLILRGLELPQHCDVCGKRRNQGNHQRCSRQRQQLKRSEKR
jgi:predicted nucleic acid-binding Zn ribbon protein